MAEGLSSECSAVAFYGLNPGRKGLERCYGALVRWFEEVGRPPNRLGVTGEGFSDNIVGFSRTNARLLKRRFDGVGGYEIYSVIPDTTYPAGDWFVTAEVSLESSCSVVAVDSSVAGLPGESMREASRRLIQHLRPSYGIGYRRQRSLGPAYYAFGVGMAPNLSQLSLEEADNISAWNWKGMEERLYLQGILRDVYPWNFLNASQLATAVGGVPLEQWIRQGEGRRQLEAINDTLSLWALDERDIPNVRPILHEADIVFDKKKHVAG